MHDLTCLIKGRQGRVRAPAGTHSICREYFLNYLTQPALLMNAAAIADAWLKRDGRDWREKRDWQGKGSHVTRVSFRALVSRHGSAISRRTIINNVGSRRRKGPQMFMKYAGMKMEERDPLVAERATTILVEKVPTASAPKT